MKISKNNFNSLNIWRAPELWQQLRTAAHYINYARQFKAALEHLNSISDRLSHRYHLSFIKRGFSSKINLIHLEIVGLLPFVKEKWSGSFFGTYFSS